MCPRQQQHMLPLYNVRSRCCRMCRGPCCGPGAHKHGCCSNTLCLCAHCLFVHKAAGNCCSLQPLLAVGGAEATHVSHRTPHTSALSKQHPACINTIPQPALLLSWTHADPPSPCALLLCCGAHGIGAYGPEPPGGRAGVGARNSGEMSSSSGSSASAE